MEHINFNENLIDKEIMTTNCMHKILINKNDMNVACTCNKKVYNFSDSGKFKITVGDEEYNKLDDLIVSYSKRHTSRLLSEKDTFFVIGNKIFKVDSKKLNTCGYARGRLGMRVNLSSENEAKSIIRIKCNSCGAYIDIHLIYFLLGSRYYDIASSIKTVYFGVYDSINKNNTLAIKKIDQEFALLNSKVVTSFTHSKIVFNLVTGRSYHIPIKIIGPNINVRYCNLRKSEKEKVKKFDKGFLELSNNGFDLINFVANMHFDSEVSKSYKNKLCLNVMHLIVPRMVSYKKDNFGLTFYNTELLNVDDKKLLNLNLALLNRYGNYYLDNLKFVDNMSSYKVLGSNLLSDFRKSLPPNENVETRKLIPKAIKERIENQTHKCKYMCLYPFFYILNVDNARKFIDLVDGNYINAEIIESILSFIKRYKWKYRKNYDETVLVNRIVLILGEDNKALKRDTRENIDNLLDIFKIFNKNYKKIDFYFTLKDIKKAHDLLALYDLKNNAKSNTDVKYEKGLQKKLDKDCGEINFKLVTNTLELAIAGTLMNICVNSYKDDVLRGDSYIVIGYKEYVPVVCIEFNDDCSELVQFKFKYNNSFSSKITEQIEGCVLDASIKYLYHIRGFIDMKDCHDVTYIYSHILKGESSKDIISNCTFFPKDTYDFDNETFEDITSSDLKIIPLVKNKKTSTQGLQRPQRANHRYADDDDYDDDWNVDRF